MGADESPAVAPPQPPAPPAQPSGNPQPGPVPLVFPKLVLGKMKVNKDGSITLTFNVTGDGLLEALASYDTASSSALRPGRGRLAYAGLKRNVKTGKVVVRLKPGKLAKKALAKRRKLRLKVVARFTPKAGKALNLKRTVNVRAPKR
jgi:hypothetical protein